MPLWGTRTVEETPQRELHRWRTCKRTSRNGILWADATGWTSVAAVPCKTGPPRGCCSLEKVSLKARKFVVSQLRTTGAAAGLLYFANLVAIAVQAGVGRWLQSAFVLLAERLPARPAAQCCWSTFLCFTWTLTTAFTPAMRTRPLAALYLATRRLPLLSLQAYSKPCSPHTLHCESFCQQAGWRQSVSKRRSTACHLLHFEHEWLARPSVPERIS